MNTRTVTVIEDFEVKNDRTPNLKLVLMKLNSLCCITFCIFYEYAIINGGMTMVTFKLGRENRTAYGV